MKSLSLIFEFVLHTGLKTLKNSKCTSMGSVLIFYVLHLLEYLSLKYTLLCVVTICLLTVQLKFWQSNNGKNKPPSLPFLTSLRMFYNALKDRKRANTLTMEFLYGCCLLYPKERMYIMPVGTEKLLLLYDPDAVEVLLTNKRNIRKGFPYDVQKPWMKDGLILSHGKKWQIRRKLLSPAFHMTNVKGFFPVYDKHANALVRKITKLIETQDVIDISLPVSSCVLDAVTETVMGKSVNAQEHSSNEVAEAFDIQVQKTGIRALSPWLWNDFIYHKTEDGKIHSKCIDVMTRFVNEAMEEVKRRNLEEQNNMNSNNVIPPVSDLGLKKQHPYSHADFLLDLSLNDDSFTAEGVEEEIHTLIAAAHDTTKVTVCWVLYLLGLHEDVQKRVHEELKEVIGQDINRAVTFEDMKNLNYLNCVVKETLRLYPAVSVITRSIDEEMVINGYTINKGMTVGIPIFMLHRDPELFPNPEVFNPDRFSQQNQSKRHAYSYIPFSSGPRSCIGRTVGMHQTMTIVAIVFRHFSVSAVEERDKMKLSFDIVLSAQNGTRLKFTKRNY